MAARDRNLNAIQICDEIKGPDGLTKVSTDTVRRQLKMLGLNGRVKRKKPFLSAKNKAARLAWAKKYQHMTKEDWRWVVFTDESPFTINSMSGDDLVKSMTKEWSPPLLNTVGVKYRYGAPSTMGALDQSGELRKRQ